MVLTRVNWPLEGFSPRERVQQPTVEETVVLHERVPQRTVDETVEVVSSAPHERVQQRSAEKIEVAPQSPERDRRVGEVGLSGNCR